MSSFKSCKEHLGIQVISAKQVLDTVNSIQAARFAILKFVKPFDPNFSLA
ncbi:MAG: hypothetical protein HOO93_09500 [Methyloglobulus sp.]|nr:hypothetical protein [Methyloglobulus sp.]